MAKLGIIGGSGMYALPGFERTEERAAATPFGAASAPLQCGRLGAVELVFLPRHGVAHVLLPEEINYRANIYALKAAGVTQIVSVCAVGSLQEQYRPGDFVVVDQFFDRTRKGRQDTFFGGGIAAHVPFGDPVCPCLSAALFAAGSAVGATIHRGGTYVNMEGPAFSTRAESNFYRQTGAAVIGMTNLTEAKLAREAELCYAALAQVTDYDCWNVARAAVTIAEILATVRRNAEWTARIIARFVQSFPPPGDCACGSALQHAIMTPWERIPRATRDALGIIISKHAPA